MNDQNVYRVFLYRDASKPIDFYRGMKVDDKAEKTVDNTLKNLMRFNVHLDAVLKRVGGAYFIEET